MADTSVEDDQPEAASLDGITEQNTVVSEESTPSNTLVAEEEAALTDNGSIADAEEARDENLEKKS
jgi:hypothetical protein